VVFVAFVISASYTLASSTVYLCVLMLCAVLFTLITSRPTVSVLPVVNASK